MSRGVAVLDQLCAVVITKCLNPYKNQTYFIRDGSINNYSQLFSVTVAGTESIKT